MRFRRKEMTRKKIIDKSSFDKTFAFEEVEDIKFVFTLYDYSFKQ